MSTTSATHEDRQDKLTSDSERASIRTEHDRADGNLFISLHLRGMRGPKDRPGKLVTVF